MQAPPLLTGKLRLRACPSFSAPLLGFCTLRPLKCHDCVGLTWALLPRNCGQELLPEDWSTPSPGHGWMVTPWACMSHSDLLLCHLFIFFFFETGTWGSLIRLRWQASDRPRKSACLYLHNCDCKDTHLQIFFQCLRLNHFFIVCVASPSPSVIVSIILE